MDEAICSVVNTSKHVFRLYGVNAAVEPILRKGLRPQDVMAFFEKLPPNAVGTEASLGSHHWARLLQTLGRSVKLIAPHLARPYILRGAWLGGATGLREVQMITPLSTSDHFVGNVIPPICTGPGAL